MKRKRRCFMKWKGMLFAAVAFAGMLPSVGTAHPEHDLSDKPALTEINAAEDWVAAFKGSSPVANAKIRVPVFRSFLFPTAVIGDSPFPLQFDSGTETTVRFATVTEQSISGTYVGGSTPQDTRIVAPRDGTYEFIARFRLTGNLTEYRMYILMKKYTANGTFIENCGRDDRNDLTGYPELECRGLVQMTKGQYLTMRFWHNKGSSAGDGVGQVFIQRVGPLPAS
jgi:hypothetical protein